MSNKVRMTLRIHPEIIDMVKRMYKQNGCTTISQYIEKAILHYIGYLKTKDPNDLLPQAFLQAMKDIVDESEEEFQKAAFPLVVELTAVEAITANLSTFDPIELVRLRGKSVQQVKCINGTLKSEE